MICIGCGVTFADRAALDGHRPDCRLVLLGELAQGVHGGAPRRFALRAEVALLVDLLITDCALLGLDADVLVRERRS